MSSAIATTFRNNNSAVARATGFRRFGRGAMTRAAVVFAVLFPVAALAQTPADIARLLAPSAFVAGMSFGAPHEIAATGGGAADLARLAPVTGSGSAHEPVVAASGGAFAAADLARLNDAGAVVSRRAPDIAVAAKQ
jgi:hypothetical protein